MDIFAEIFAEIDRLKPKLRKVGGEDATMTTEEVREKFDALTNKIIDLRHQTFNKELDDAVIDFYFAGGADSLLDSTGLAPIRKIAHFAADWQKEKDARDMYMSDNRHFEKVYQLGRTDMRDQMLKGAVEWDYTLEDGRIEIEGDPLPCLNPILNLPYPKFKPGQKVKLIVVKEDEK